jgi:hypothetical protein
MLGFDRNVMQQTGRDAHRRRDLRNQTLYNAHLLLTIHIQSVKSLV